MYSSLNEINSPEINISTAEDPIEYDLAGLCQVQTHKDIGLDFARIVTVNAEIDLVLLQELGELVYPGGGVEILKLVADVRAGKLIQF